MPKLSEDQQLQRRNRILDAAEGCFATAGFHRTTMQDICKAAGISPGALYLYFDSKEALISGISTRDCAEIMKQFSLLTEAEDFFEGLRTVMRTCVVENPRHKSQLYLAMAAEAASNPAIAAIMAECDGAIRASLSNILHRAQAEGRIAPAVPVSRLVDVMGVIADGLFWRRAVNPTFDLVPVASDLLQFIGALVGRRDAQPRFQEEAAQ